MASESRFKRIMVPLDGSDFAEASLSWALALARRDKARLDLVAVVSPYAFPNPRNPQEEAIVQGWFTEEEERLTRYLTEAKGRIDADVEVRTHTPKGRIVPTLLERAEVFESDLIVMTTHGRGGLQRVWLGSVADTLLREASQPVLVIPARDEEDAPDLGEPALNRILVPLDGSDRSEAVLESAAGIAVRSGATLSLLTILPRPMSQDRSFVAYGLDDGESTGLMLEGLQSYVESLAAELREQGVEVETAAIQAASAADGILERAAEEPADLIMLATRGRGGMRRMMLGSVADKVIRGAGLPVLVHRVPEDREDD